MRRIISPLVLVAAAALLSGCVVMPTLGGGGVQPQPRASVGDEASPAPLGDTCVGGAITLNQPGDHVIGDCNEVTIEGSGVDLKAGSVGTLIIRGTDNDVEAASIGDIDISGQDNDVDSRGSVGAIAIAGDDNDIEVIGDLGTVTIEGNENDVSASGRIGSVSDNGDRNEVRGAQP